MLPRDNKSSCEREVTLAPGQPLPFHCPGFIWTGPKLKTLKKTAINICNITWYKTAQRPLTQLNFILCSEIVCHCQLMLLFRKLQLNNAGNRQRILSYYSHTEAWYDFVKWLFWLHTENKHWRTSKVYLLSFYPKLSVSSMPRKSQHVKCFP